MFGKIPEKSKMKLLQIQLGKFKQLVADGFFHILVGNVLIKAAAFVSSVVIVRLVSKAEYAYLGYADNLFQYINLLSGLGLSTAILKFCAPSVSKGINKYYYRLAMRVGVLFQLIISVVLVWVVMIIKIPFPNAKGIVAMLVLYPTLTQVITTMQSYIRAHLDNKLFAKIGVVQTIALLLFSVPLALLLGVYGAVAARYLSLLIVIVMAYKFTSTSLPADIETSVPAQKERTLFWKLAISMMLANLFSMIMPLNEQFLINNYIKDEITSANYKVAFLIPSQIVFVTNSVVVYMFPKVAQLGDKLQEAFRITIKTEALLAAVILGMCLVGYFVSPILIVCVYGERYSDAIELSKAYWVVYGINAGFRILPMNMLPAMGSTLFNSILSVISCIAHGALLYVLLEEKGIWGAPYALVIVYAISGCAYWAYICIRCRRKRKQLAKIIDG